MHNIVHMDTLDTIERMADEDEVRAPIVRAMRSCPVEVSIAVHCATANYAARSAR